MNYTTVHPIIGKLNLLVVRVRAKHASKACQSSYTYVYKIRSRLIHINTGMLKMYVQDVCGHGRKRHFVIVDLAENMTNI